MAEFKLSYTANEINEKLSKIDNSKEGMLVATEDLEALTPADIGALNKSGDTMSGDLHYYGHMYINRNYGGWAKTVGNDTDPNVPKLRNSSLSATETSPTEDGTICWIYE